MKIYVFVVQHNDRISELLISEITDNDVHTIDE